MHILHLIFLIFFLSIIVGHTVQNGICNQFLSLGTHTQFIVI